MGIKGMASSGHPWERHGSLELGWYVSLSLDTQGLAQPGQGRQGPHGPHLPMDCGAKQGAGHYVREPLGQEYWGLGQRSLGSCWLPAVPHQPCFPAQVLYSWNGAQREKLGHHYGHWDSLKPTKTLLSLYLHGRRRP